MPHNTEHYDDHRLLHFTHVWQQMPRYFVTYVWRQVNFAIGLYTITAIVNNHIKPHYSHYSHRILHANGLSLHVCTWHSPLEY